MLGSLKFLKMAAKKTLIAGIHPLGGVPEALEGQW